MRALQPWLRAYVVATVVAGLAMLAYVSGDLQSLDWHPRSLANLILWSVMIAVAAMSPIPLPRGGATVTVTSALDFAAILIFGPAIACWFGVMSDLLTNVAVKRNPPHKVAFNVGQVVLSIGTAGLVYQSFGGRIGAAFTLDATQIVPLLAAPLVYFLLNTGLISVAIGMRERISAFRIWQTNFQWEILHVFFFLPFGILLSLVHLRIGPVGVLLFLIPLFLARFSFKLWIDTKASHIATVQALVSAIDASDPFTRGDVGKIAIQHDILLKPGRLTESERALMKTHPTVGHDILKGLKFLEGAAEIVYCHHEQPNGQGYPRALKADRIPMGSRIIMVVDAFDAMTSDRPYRRGLAPEIAYEELHRHTGTQFFPDVVDALVELHQTGALFDEIDVGELEMYTSDRYNSRILEEYVMEKLEQTYGPDNSRYLERMRERRESRSDLPAIATIDPNRSPPAESADRAQRDVDI